MKAQYQQVWPVFSQIQSIARGILANLSKQHRSKPPYPMALKRKSPQRSLQAAAA